MIRFWLFIRVGMLKLKNARLKEEVRLYKSINKTYRDHIEILNGRRPKRDAMTREELREILRGGKL